MFLVHISDVLSAARHGTDNAPEFSAPPPLVVAVAQARWYLLCY